MVIFIAESVYFFILLIGGSVSFVEGDNAADPTPLVKHKVQKLPEVENFASMEAKLETITDMAKLYQIAESLRADVLKKLRQMPEVQTIINECKKFNMPFACSETPYRTIDGSCHNMKHSDWGKTVTEQRRLLPANYEGTSGFRKSASGEDLPNARLLSLSMRNISNPSALSSALFTFFGQFVAHDISLTPSMTENGDIPDCCNPSNKDDPFCAPVDLGPKDPFYAQFNKTCLGFRRTTPYPSCNFTEKRGLINKKSSFIDASQIYSNSDDKAMKLRTNDGTGKLRSQNTKFGKLLPPNHDQRALFCPAASIDQCFEGGDDRLNQHTMLITLQTIFLRLHNNMADGLHNINPTWDDETIYQEARRIIIALLQYVIYNEYLPLLIGPDNMEKLDLAPDFLKGSSYDDELDPSVLVEFSGGAYRAHSMVPTFVSAAMPRLKFRNTYSQFQPIHRGRLDSLLAGASEVPSENEDEFQTDDISNNLYKPPGRSFGGDMTTTDIQRGRDVGLPTYVDMVNFCFNGLQIKNFSQLGDSGLMTQNNVRELMNIYEDVNDIDLLYGLLREIRDDNAEFGPTSACIASIQFNRIKFGDSFYFTHTNGRNPFSKDQLESLRSYSLGRIICETTNRKTIRQSPLQFPSNNNPLVRCSTFPPMNLQPWGVKSS